jgi:hypothetical protein
LELKFSHILLNKKRSWIQAHADNDRKHTMLRIKPHDVEKSAHDVALWNYCPGVFGTAVVVEGPAVVPLGAIARGALTPATSEPSPIFCKLSASSFPVGGKPFAAWKRRSES